MTNPTPDHRSTEKGVLAVELQKALRASCGATNGCSCADLNYQWYGLHCKATMTSVFRSLIAPEKNALRSLPAPAHQENSPRSAGEFRMCDCVSPPEPDPQPCRCAKSDNPFWQGYAAGLQAPRHAPGAPEPAPQVREALERAEQALHIVAEFMREDVKSGNSKLWTPEFEAMHDNVIVAREVAQKTLRALTPVVAREPVQANTEQVHGQGDHLSGERAVADAMNVLLLIEHGCDQAWARHFVNCFDMKCEELARERRVSEMLNGRIGRLEHDLIQTENKLSTAQGRVKAFVAKYEPR